MKSSNIQEDNLLNVKKGNILLWTFVTSIELISKSKSHQGKLDWLKLAVNNEETISLQENWIVLGYYYK
jgi:hypothetical protein